MGEESKLRRFMSTKYFSLLVVIVIMLVAFYFLTKGRLLTPLNIRSIFNGMVIVSFLALGGGMLILFGYIDLSQGYVGSLSGCIVAVLTMSLGVPVWLAIIAGIAGSSLCGLFNALMVNKLHFEPFIATLALGTVVQGLGYNLVTGKGMGINDDFIKWLGSFKLFDKLLPITIIIAVVFFAFYGIILAKTKFGRTVYLCGGNKQAARLAGLKPKGLSYILFINSGFLAGVCGILVISRTGTAYATTLASYQFTGLTAAMLGGIAFGGGSGNMLGCFLGMFILSLFNNATSLLGLDSNLASIFNGMLLIIALAIDAVSAGRQARRWVKKSLLEDNN